MDETTGTPGTSPEPAPAPALPADEPRGFLASALTPIAPAHPAADDADDEAAGSSADYHSGEYAETEEATTAQDGSVMRAFLLAAVERWRKGAGTAVKALEVEKAKAQSRQTRTNHTISENRVGGATTTNTNDNKGNKDVKSANNRTHAVNNANQAKSNRDDKNASNHNRDDKNHRQNQGRTNRDDKTSSNKDAKNSSAKNSSATTSKDDKNHDTDANTNSRSTKSSTDSKNSGDSKTASDSKNAKGDQRTTTVHDGEGGGALAPNSKATPKTGKPTGPQNQRPGATDPEQGQSQGQPGQQQPDGKQSPEPADTTPAATRPRTQTARETGYRDGHRAARGVAQVRAYVDGTRDGYADGTEQAAKEKVQLDKAHAGRKAQRASAQQNPQQTNTNGAQQPVSGTNTVVPITVKGIDKERVYLGDGAARDSMTRGEVRNLKTFERRLKARSAQMIKAAEVLKALVAYEKEQARKALALVEKAKSVKGGEKLIPKLQRLAEAAKQEAAAAEEAYKQAVRAAESVKVLLANVEKRDGLIYKAVVDSPETMPAEMEFYKEAA
ncbi:hypothetical protein ACH4ZX_35170 [Streptomyces sp. NPDC020490]|uniref:hypothetical protein n=1 Tax=Streptomyces sp. NPDC020490 TaxID=3365078 RepID=UPI0037BD3E53